ncbi:hypothetical protein TL16_g00322 [Triparma laevis f. inornata]|uniref:Uncharacterized protein n=1 Tax=Triparma laevis f. inornata TaxID=1714386 RepID=A0A9W7DNA7_9STRA|nr:hypothetical protein TL16_g00322 [Triparma laevis f. inornata]
MVTLSVFIPLLLWIEALPDPSSSYPPPNPNPSSNASSPNSPGNSPSQQRSSWTHAPPPEKRHTIGGKRFSITPLQSDLLLFNDDGSHEMSEEGIEENGDDSDTDQSEKSDAPSINSNLTDEESYAVDTDSDIEGLGLDGESVDGSKGSSKRLPFSQYQPEADDSSSQGSFDITLNIMSTLKESLSPSSKQRYEAPTPKASDVKIKKKEKKKQRRSSRAVAMKKDHQRKEAAATKIKYLLYIRRALNLVRFLRLNPHLLKAGGHSAALTVQRFVRGCFGRRRVQVLRGEYVFNPNLEMLILRHGGANGLLNYVKKLEQENEQLLLDIANVNTKNLLTGGGFSIKRPQTEGADLPEPQIFYSDKPLPLSFDTKKLPPREKKYLLYKKDGKSNAWVEQKLSIHGEHRLDVIQSTSLVKKEEKKKDRKVKKEFMERTGKGMPNPKIEMVSEVIMRDPVREVEEIEGRRGLVGDIEEEVVEVEEKKVETVKETIKEVNVEPEEEEEEEEKIPQMTIIAPILPPPTELTPAKTFDANSSKTSNDSPQLDAVMQWRMQRGYLADMLPSETKGKKTTKTKNKKNKC